MSSCTIYICHPNPAVCVEGLIRRARISEIEIHPLTREKPGDPFSRLILGTHNFARTRAKKREDTLQPVLDLIAATSVIVGVPREPESPALAMLTKGIDCVIFDGATFRDSKGKNLLE